MSASKGFDLPPIADPDEFIPTRLSLLSRLRDLEDQDSWRDFFQTYWKFIYGIARKSGLTEIEAQEVVQETIISVVRQIPDFHYDPAHGSFKGWLWRITSWRIQDQYRKRQRDQKLFVNPGSGTEVEDRLTQFADPNAVSPAAIWEEEWQKNLLQAALDRVKQQTKAKQYQIFDLAVLKHWSTEKITATLGINVGQVYLARHRVSTLLKKEVQRLTREIETGGH